VPHVDLADTPVLGSWHAFYQSFCDCVLDTSVCGPWPRPINQIVPGTPDWMVLPCHWPGFPILGSLGTLVGLALRCPWCLDPVVDCFMSFQPWLPWLPGLHSGASSLVPFPHGDWDIIGTRSGSLVFSLGAPAPRLWQFFVTGASIGEHYFVSCWYFGCPRAPF
jgi:hypothetical protein